MASVQETIQTQLARGAELKDSGVNYKSTYAGKTKGASMEAGPAQAKNMQTATTVGNRIPQVDTSEYAYNARFHQNAMDTESAIKATSEGAGYKPTKDVKKTAFPETGADYLSIVNTNTYGDEETPSTPTPTPSTPTQP